MYYKKVFVYMYQIFFSKYHSIKILEKTLDNSVFLKNSDIFFPSYILHKKLILRVLTRITELFSMSIH